MEQRGCVRVMACVPSTRVSMAAWLQRRGFRSAGGSAYPAEALGHTLRPLRAGEESSGSPPGLLGVQLSVYVKPLEGAAVTADVKKPKSTVLSTNPEEEEGPPPLPVVPGKMHLPPHWRYPSAPLVASTPAGSTLGAESEPKGRADVDDEGDDELPLD